MYSSRRKCIMNMAADWAAWWSRWEFNYSWRIKATWLRLLKINYRNCHVDFFLMKKHVMNKLSAIKICVYFLFFFFLRWKIRHVDFYDDQKFCQKFCSWILRRSKDFARIRLVEFCDDQNFAKNSPRWILRWPKTLQKFA